MGSTRQSRQTYSAGEKGRNRVRVFPDSKTGNIQLEWRENGRRLSRSLGHKDWLKAKRQADEFAANYVRPEPHVKTESSPEPLTLERLFDIYRCEVTRTKAERTNEHDKAASEMFLEFLGRDRDPNTLSKRDWDRFIQERRHGRLGLSGRPVSDRTVEKDLRFLLAILNWATQSRDEGGLLLERNPLKGLKPPVEKNPTRVVLTEKEYRTLLDISLDVEWRFHVALILAHETGHRIGAIRQLRWSDVDLEKGSIRWRAEHEKNGVEHTLPMTEDALAALELARMYSPGIGDAPVFPAPKDLYRPRFIWTVDWPQELGSRERGRGYVPGEWGEGSDRRSWRGGVAGAMECTAEDGCSAAAASRRRSGGSEP